MGLGVYGRLAIRSRDPVRCGTTDAWPRPAPSSLRTSSGGSPAATGTDGTKVIHSAGAAETLPGTPARGDDLPPSGDTAVDEAYDATERVHSMFATTFGRDSTDGSGAAVTVTVHYGENYDNAFWNGEQLVLGDGDGAVFERLTASPDVLFHEFTHGVTQFTAALAYEGQPGALNESMSDCFASMCKQQSLDQTASEADWLIGEGLFRPGIRATALRSMSEPGTAYDDPLLGTDPQVGAMDDYVDTTDDNGGVHLNSGIPNRAFYLAATAIGGSSWEAPGQIWYAALTGGAVAATTDFAGFARATADAAAALFGDDSQQA
ncbi:MAG: M4 family metallopeptidase, partial [Nocardioidaceae bacterium]